MKPWIATIALLLLVGTAFAEDKAELGKVVPDQSWTTLDGKEIKLSELRKTAKEEGKIVMIHFWSFKCPSGRKIHEQLAELTAKCEKEGIVFIGICAYGESEAALKSFASENKIAYTLCHDTDKKGAKLLGAKKVTTTYVLDKEGKLVYRGAWDKAWDAAEATKAGKEVKEKETKAGG